MSDNQKITGQQMGRECVCFNLRKAARLLSRRYDEALADTGLKTTQFSLMAALLGYPGLPVTTMAEALGMDRTTLTRNLQPLVRKGMIEVTKDPADQRSRLVSLTDRGRDTIEAALPKWRQVQAETLNRLGDDDWLHMRSALRALSGAA